MKYNIYINQKELKDTKLDIIDGAIINYLFYYCNSVSQKIEEKRIVDDMGVWTWVDYEALIKDMPLLRIKAKTALSKRFAKIEKEGFIKTKLGVGKRVYVKLEAKMDSLEVDNSEAEMTKMTSETRQKSPISFPEMTKMISRNDQDDFSIYDNNTKDNNTNKNVLSSPTKAPTQVKTKVRTRPPLEKQTMHERIVFHLEDTLHTKVPNWGKQAKAIKMMEQAGYTEKQIVWTINYMAKDEFYEDKGFDLMTVCNQIAQVKAKVRKEVNPHVQQNYKT